jgi:hypothetical protein
VTYTLVVGPKLPFFWLAQLQPGAWCRSEKGSGFNFFFFLSASVFLELAICAAKDRRVNSRLPVIYADWEVRLDYQSQQSGELSHIRHKRPPHECGVA